jgi:Nif-specific regulatory protein
MIIEAIPRLLELANEAEDERAALKSSCAWARKQRGIAAVGFYAVAASRPIATEGVPFSGCESVAASFLSASDAKVILFDGQVVASEPVRYSGVRIGSVVARGLEEESAAIRQAVSTLAAIGAPALRACADAEIAAVRDDSGLADDILGRSPAMVSVRQTIARVAPAPFAVLIEGASGTGKELAARAIHRLSPRRDRRFSAVNCAALTDELVEAELFGHSRGAFTGAVAARSGLFEDAHLGTVFLDEVGELSPRAQAKLLRVLQEREVKRVGENLTRPVDVRVIAATNRPLAEAVGRGLFRDDLLFRIAVVRLRMPPLSERLEDVPQLALSVWRRAIRDVGKSSALGADAIGALCRHRWPGNVRELQNVIAAMAVLAPERGRAHARHVHAVLGHTSAVDHPEEVVSLVAARRLSDRRTITAALARHGGRQSAAARELGLSRQGLAKAMRRIGLRPSRTIDVA